MSGLRADRQSVVEVWRTQGSVIGALMMREIYSRFGRSNIGFLWLFVEPAMFSSGVIALWMLAKSDSHVETPVVPFILTGYMPLLLYRHVVQFSLRCMQSNQSLFFHRHVAVLSVYLARQIVEVFGVIVAFIACMVYFGIFGFVEMPYDISMMTAGWLLYIWYCMAFAMVVGGLSERSEMVHKLWHPLSYITIPTTGAFFMLYWLPPEAREILLFFPQVTASEILRGGYFGPSITIYTAVEYSIGVCTALTVFGLYLIRGARRHLETV